MTRLLQRSPGCASSSPAWRTARGARHVDTVAAGRHVTDRARGGARSLRALRQTRRRERLRANGADPLPPLRRRSWADGRRARDRRRRGQPCRCRARARCAVTAATPGSTRATNASNRLIATAFGTLTNAGPGGAATTPSRVYTSNPGQPEVWETDGNPAGPPRADATSSTSPPVTASRSWPPSRGANWSSSSRRRSFSCCGARAPAPTARRRSRSARSSTRSGSSRRWPSRRP
jgi:hypothetical protein